MIEHLSRHIKTECAEIESLLRREQYVRRILFADGVNAQFEAIWRSMRRKQSASGASYSDEDLFAPRRMLLLGGAGSGKSLVIKRAFVGAASRFATGGPAPFLLDLDAHLGTRLDVVEALDTKYQGVFSKAIAEYNPGCYLMIDSLDDRLLRSDRRFPNDLKAVLQGVNSKLAGCFIACFDEPLLTRTGFRNFTARPRDVSMLTISVPRSLARFFLTKLNVVHSSANATG